MAENTIWPLVLSVWLILLAVAGTLTLALAIWNLIEAF